MWPFKWKKKVEEAVVTQEETRSVPVVDTINWDWEAAYYGGPAILQTPRPMVRKDQHLAVTMSPDQVILWGDLPDPEVGRIAMEALMGLFTLRDSECPEAFLVWRASRYVYGC